MNGHVFQCYDEQDDRRQYARTLEALTSYIQKTFKYAEDLEPLFAEKMVMPKVVKPITPDPSADEIDKLIYAEEVKEYVKCARTLTGNLMGIHAVIWGQSSKAMRDKLKSMPRYKKIPTPTTALGF